jgi:hypothetical protein
MTVLRGSCLYGSRMMSPWYRRLFATRLSPHRQAVQKFITTRQGCRFATSNRGVLTGRGADIILVDDRLKFEEALSEAQGKAANECTTTLSKAASTTSGIGGPSSR